MKINASDQRVISHFLNSLPQGAKNVVLAGSDLTSETNILEKARMHEQMTPRNQSKDNVNPVVDDLKSDVPIDSSENYYEHYYDNVNHISNQRGNFSARRGGYRSRGRGGRGFYRNTDSNNMYTNPGTQNDYGRGRGGGPRGHFRGRGGRGRGSRTPQHDSSSTKNTKPKKCYACQGDHLIKECPFDPKNKKPKCYNCGLSTHLKNKCPFLRK